MTRNFFLFSFLSLCSCSCTAGSREANEIPYSAQLNPKHEFSITLRGRIDRYFGMHTIRVDSADRLFYLNDSAQLVFLDPAGSSSFQIDFSGYTKGLHLYTASVSGNLFYFLNLDSLTLYCFDITGRALIERKQIRLNKLVAAYTPGLYGKDNPDKPFVRFQRNNTFTIHSHFLYVAYAVYDRKTQFLDDHAYLKIDIDDSPAIAKKVFLYPYVFRSGRYDNNHTFLNFFSNGDCLYSFLSYDSIYKLDDRESIVTASVLNSNARFRQFNRKKRRDLGYVRIYTLTNEANTTMITGKKDEVLVIRQLAREKMADPGKFDLYILDSSLQVKYKNAVPFRVHPFFHTGFKNGFLVFNASLDKAYYYETP